MKNHPSFNTPPVDNAHVAPGCDRFDETMKYVLTGSISDLVDAPKPFLPSYGTGLEIQPYGLHDEGGPEYRVVMKQNGCFVATTRSRVNAQAIALIPDMIQTLKEIAEATANNEPISAKWASEMLAKFST